MPAAAPDPTPFVHEGQTTTRGLASAAPAADAPTLVFCPGNGFTAECYLPALRPLADQAGLLLWNPPGFGGSTVPEDFPGVAAYGDALAELLDARTEGPLVLAGHSIGGWMALRAAMRLSQNPQRAARVRGLLLVDPLVMGRMDEDWPPARKPAAFELERRTRERRAQWPSREEAAGILRTRPAYAHWDAEAFDAYIASGLLPAPEGGVQLACPPWLEAAIYGTRNKPEVLDWVREIPVPAVLVAGAQSDVCDGDGAGEFTACFPAACVLTLPGDHFFPMVRPAATARVLATGLGILQRGMAPPAAAD